MKDLVSNQIVRYLEARDVEHIFGLCGHTNIALLAALEKSERISFVNVRHEQIAAHAADGYARVTKRAGVVLTHLGPGLTNATTGVANAALDSIPMVVIAGDVPTHYFGKHPHQEINLHADAAQWEIYRPFVKRAWRVDQPHLIAEVLDKAFTLAESGRPGPVLVDVPMDVFSAEIDVALFDKVLSNTRSLAKPSLDEEVAERIVRNLLDGRQAGALRRRRDRRRGCGIRAQGVRRAPVAARRAQPHGQGRTPRRQPSRAGDDGLLGYGVRQRDHPDRGLDPRARHAVRRGRLELVVCRVHVRHPGHEAHADRYRSRRAGPELPPRDRRARGSQVCADRAHPGRPPAGSFGSPARRTPRADRGEPRDPEAAELGCPGVRCMADAPGADPLRDPRGSAAGCDHHDRRRLEQERRGSAVRHPHPGHVPHPGRLRDHGLRRAGGRRRQDRPPGSSRRLPRRRRRFRAEPGRARHCSRRERRRSSGSS